MPSPPLTNELFFGAVLVVDAASKFMITASGNRGWFGDTTKTVIVHSITPQ